MTVVHSAVGSVEPVIVVHGGAGTVSPELREAAPAGAKKAAELGQRVLLDGGSCEDAVIAAIRSMEDDPTFNAGRGSCMTRDGEFEVDAALMRSIDLRAGAIAGVKNLRDGILVAQKVMNETRHCLLAGDAAEAFARAHGVGSFGRDEVWTEKAQRRFDDATAGKTARDNRADTVGAVALDRHGHMASGGSTGGVLLKLPGRVGDTPMIGSGLYAHPQLGASAATGVGEAIMTYVMSYEVLRRARDGELQAHAEALCAEVQRATRAAVGLICVSPDGEIGIAHGSQHMSWAHARGDSPVAFGLTWPPAAD
jgi:beta-aspartyl-peptidase (threonine type)